MLWVLIRSEALLVSTHNIYFYREIKKKMLCGYLLLSVAMNLASALIASVYCLNFEVFIFF